MPEAHCPLIRHATRPVERDMNPQDRKPESRAAARGLDAGRWFLLLIGLSLILIGSLFIALMTRSFLRAEAMRDWARVECVILESRIEERQHDPLSPIEYRPLLLYGYDWKDKRLTSNAYSLRGGKWSSQIQRARGVLEGYPAGSRTICLVNPDNPVQAVLKPDSLAPLYSIWFPALFVIGGIGIMVRVWQVARSH